MPEMESSTEYTLQGVMRFLQIEWHNHERVRNAWDIERAEMKAKIAKQEGDCRSMKKMNELLEKQVKMLEKALKTERANNRARAQDEESPQLPSEDEVKEAWNGKIGVKPSASFPGIEVKKASLEQSAESDREAQRDNSKVFLQKCLEELTYLLTPPAHPLPPQPNHQPQGSSFEPQDIPSHDPYIPHQQAQPRRRNPQLSHLPSLPNHPPPPRSAPEFYQPSQVTAQPDTIPTHTAAQTPESLPPTAEELQSQHTSSRQLDEPPVERVTHSFDAYGRPLPPSEINEERSLASTDSNGWDFDESNTLLDTNPPDSNVPPRTHIEQTDQFPNVNHLPAKSPPRVGHGSHRRKSSGSIGHMSRKHSSGNSHDLGKSQEASTFKVKYALRGHLDVVRSVIFTGGGTPSEPEVCTTGDDSTIKRWIIPASYTNAPNGQQHPASNAVSDTDITSYFTHRGHEGTVTCLAACPSSNGPASPSFSTGGRTLGDGWIFSGGQDATIRVWERGRVDPKATIDGHSDTIWALAVLPVSASSVLGGAEAQTGNPSLSATTHPILPAARDDRILLASGSADGSIKIWAVSAPPALHSPQGSAPGARRQSRRLSVTSGSNFPSSPQPSTASGTPFHYSLIHNIDGLAGSPTSIAPLGPAGESFVVSFNDAQVVVFDTRTGESVVGMQSQETYDGTPGTGVNSVVVAGPGLTTSSNSEGTESGKEPEEEVHGATGSANSGGVEGVIITGHEDRFVRFFDANSGQCTYSMVAHLASIASLSLSPDGRELLTAGHDASVRVWNLEKRTCTQECTVHRLMRAEGVVSATWSLDGRLLVTAGGDGVVKVLGRG